MDFYLFYAIFGQLGAFLWGCLSMNFCSKLNMRFSFYASPRKMRTKIWLAG